MQIVAHRGASWRAPENTLASVRLGWEEAADAVEVDVVVSKDGRIMVNHDEDLSRTARVSGRVREHTAEELRRLDVGAWKGKEWAGERMPFLDEVVETVPHGRTLYVDIKCGAEIVSPLGGLLLAGRGRPVVLIGEFLDVMREVKAAFPQQHALWVVSLRKCEPADDLADSLLGRAAEAGLDGLGLSCHPLLTRELARQVQAAGQELYVWTVDQAEDARRVEQYGAGALATNRPAGLRADLARERT